MILSQIRILVFIRTRMKQLNYGNENSVQQNYFFFSACCVVIPFPQPHPGALELADCSADLPGLKWMPGVTSWKVLEMFSLLPDERGNYQWKCVLQQSSWIGEKALTQLVSTADDQGGPVVSRLVRGSQQSAHANPPHHVPTKRSWKTNGHASGEMVRAHSSHPNLQWWV